MCTRSIKEITEVLVLPYVRRDAKVASSGFLILFALQYMNIHISLS